MLLPPMDYESDSSSPALLPSDLPSSTSSPCSSNTASSHSFSFAMGATPSHTTPSHTASHSNLATSHSTTALSFASTSPPSRMSRLVCVRTPVFSSFGAYLYPFVGYPFLVQTRLFASRYHVLLAATAVYALVAGWSTSSNILCTLTVWMFVRAVLTVALHMAYPSLVKYYQHPPRALRRARHSTRAVSLVLICVSLLMSARDIEADDPSNATLAMWSVLLCEFSLWLCANVVYGSLLLVFRNKELSYLFPYIQPAVFLSLFPDSSSAASVTAGLTRSELRLLPCEKYRVDMLPSLAEDGCVICQGCVNDGDAVRLLRCGHGFHRDCIDQWLQRRSVCPLCVQVVQADGTTQTKRQQQVELVVHQPVEA